MDKQTDRHGQIILGNKWMNDVSDKISSWLCITSFIMINSRTVRQVDRQAGRQADRHTKGIVETLQLYLSIKSHITLFGLLMNCSEVH